MNYEYIKQRPDGWDTNKGFVPDNPRIRAYRLIQADIADGAQVLPQHTAEELEANRQDLIKAECRRRIYAVYSSEDQRNLIAERPRATVERQAEIDEVHDWIIAMVATSQTARAQGTELVDITWPVA